MTYDPAVPDVLKKTQQWFAGIITQPIDDDSCINPIAPSGEPIQREAWKYIVPSHTLNPAARIEIYNQQYWWRLLAAIQEAFPLVVRLFGYHDFNKLLAMPYIVKYPSQHFSLTFLGDRFTQWIQEEYHADDKPLVYHAAEFDWAFNYSFVSDRGVPLELAEEDLFTTSLILQPHVQLFEWPFDLFQYRKEFLKQEPDYWIEHDFPKLQHMPPGEFVHYVLYRNHQNSIMMEQITQSEYQTLYRFTSGSSVDEICQWLDQQPQDSPLLSEATQQLQTWFQKWSSRQFLIAKK